MNWNVHSYRLRTQCAMLGFALAVAVTGCGGGDGTPRLAVTFDGSTCEYDGSDQMPAGDIEASFSNDSDLPAGLAFISVPIGTTVDPGVGASRPITTSEPEIGDLVGVVELEAGEDGQETAALTPGTHVLDCVTFGPDGPTHYWRGAIIDVER